MRGPRPDVVAARATDEERLDGAFAAHSGAGEPSAAPSGEENREQHVVAQLKALVEEFNGKAAALISQLEAPAESAEAGPDAAGSPAAQGAP